MKLVVGSRAPIDITTTVDGQLQSSITTADLVIEGGFKDAHGIPAVRPRPEPQQWDVNEEVALLELDEEPICFALSRDGSKLAVGFHGLARIYDVQENNGEFKITLALHSKKEPVVVQMPVPARVEKLESSPTGKQLAAVLQSEQELSDGMYIETSSNLIDTPFSQSKLAAKKGKPTAAARLDAVVRDALGKIEKWARNIYKLNVDPAPEVNTGTVHVLLANVAYTIHRQANGRNDVIEGGPIDNSLSNALFDPTGSRLLVYQPWW